MKNLVFIFLTFLLFTGCKSNETEKVVITDGVYITDFPMHGLENLKHYLKFNNDSTVFSLSSPFGLDSARKVLMSTSRNVGRGTFTLVDDSLKFQTRTQSGVVLYKGIIKHNEKLILNIKSLINGHEFHKKEFIFQAY
ncbi:hypothetical protein I2I11_13895 [Pontibacter sp. 172403-2]|uniref:hypothetical protein n=1 Tax=Pontibacter rufus TaxID=2791028 RepID=UPI0018AF8B2B|nr:hypothetical protein [Pontibacter sp. 172403-2]MBF9254393.1 hypothetical protein [Pontibacter sp. 172403-2]